MKKIFMFLLIVLLFPIMRIRAEEIVLAQNAKSAILMESSTGTIIYEKNPHEKYSPASMTKIMTMLLIIENIENGVLKWDDMVTVSENASKMGGSQILLETGEKMNVRDLFKGIAIASGNDASVALAEEIYGTQENFVSMMNKRAKELGLKNTNFKNVHGLDAANHYTSAYDMAIMARELVKHEKVLEYTSIYEDYLRIDSPRKVWLVNTNKLVRFYDGVDGLKTGYTSDAGYCLTATAKKNKMRVIAIVMGEPDSKVRNKEISEMLNYAFAQYDLEYLLSTNSVIGKIEIDKGNKKNVNVVPVEDVTILHKKTDNKKTSTYEVKLDLVKAPVKKGDVIGKLIIKEDEKITRETSVTVSEDIKKASIIQLYFRYLKEIFTGDL